VRPKRFRAATQRKEKTMKMTPTDQGIQVGSYPVCGSCGASAVLRDAWAIWNPMTGTWELQATFNTYRCEACNGPTQLAWKIDTEFRKKRVCRLNDALRQGEVLHGSIVLTSGIQELGDEAIAEILRNVAGFDTFSEDNDPYGEHDYGSISHEEKTIFWKIDYFDRDLKWHSPDKANPDVTQRVLTIMLASEY
jgi:uncharacterized protein DUF3768